MRKIIWEKFTPGNDNGITVDEKLPEIVTPTAFGPLYLGSNFHPMNMFNFWIGHTNFDITKKELEIISRIIGVEVAAVHTRYRFIIAVGKAFNEEQVKGEIEKSLCNKWSFESVYDMISDVSVRKNFEDLYKSISDYKHWAIFLFFTGKMDHIYTNNETIGFSKTVKKFYLAQDAGLGIYVGSE